MLVFMMLIIFSVSLLANDISRINYISHLHVRPDIFWRSNITLEFMLLQ